MVPGVAAGMPEYWLSFGVSAVAATGSGGVVGMILGGVLTSYGSWRWCLLINLPLGLAVLAVALRHLRESTSPRPSRFNVGVATAIIAVGGTVGSFLYGAVHLPGSLPRQLCIALALYGLGILALIVEPAPVLGLLLLLILGFCNGPADAIEALLLGEQTPPARQAQAFAWLVTANWTRPTKRHLPWTVNRALGWDTSTSSSP